DRFACRPELSNSLCLPTSARVLRRRASRPKTESAPHNTSCLPRAEKFCAPGRGRQHRDRRADRREYRLRRCATNEVATHRRFRLEPSTLSGSVFPGALRRRIRDTVFRQCDQRRHSAAAENFTENVERIVKPAAKTSALLKRGVTETVVGGALVRIHQDVVGLTELFEFFFGVGVIRIFIRMKLYRELAISAFDLLF